MALLAGLLALSAGSPPVPTMSPTGPSPSLSPVQRRHRDVLVLAHLELADRIAAAWARSLGRLAERDDLIQVARLALVLSAARVEPGRPAAPYLRRCIEGALKHHLRDRVRLVRISRRAHEAGRWPLAHLSLDAPHPDGGCWIDHLSAPNSELPNHASVAEMIQPQAAPAAIPLTLEALLEQLPAQQAAALRLTVLQGQSLRSAAQALGTSCSTLNRRQRKALATLRHHLAAR